MTEAASARVRSDPDATRWRSVLARDRRADGTFVYAVSSTGVFCRPSCASRRPRRDRVRFFDSPVDAARAGYRPCKRCRPHVAAVDPWPARIRQACEYLGRVDGHLSLRALAARLGGSAFHLQRNFKRLVGLTPRAYAEACRLGNVKRRLKSGVGVTTAMMDAGYGSSSRFYERAVPKLGMSPSTYRRGGAGMTIHYTITDSPLGRLLVASTTRGVCAVEMASSDTELERNLTCEYPSGTISRVPEPDPAWTQEVLDRVTGRMPRIDLPLDVRATSFQWQVWQALAAIPHGETRSYGEVAASIGRPQAARAVARACASNPVAVAIPCHRVVGKNGEPAGYRWGVARKRALLDHERAGHARSPIARTPASRGTTST
jgi:AraC family transcriptional regulator, regulatory protein of adaptative response / methylated-DNA-[protein]-cysteine methyltransferase